MKHIVSIVGAGPGDPDLLTVKAYRLLQDADLVLYDSLMGDEILGVIPESTEQVYVGKTHCDMQCQEVRQQRINSLMYSGYLDGKKVVRLKTGDPLIFGRGIEEIRFLKEKDVPYELIPGVTAGIAAANNFQIPITERCVNTTLLFCTGTTAKNEFKQFASIAMMIKEGTPLVLYMGLKNIDNIIEQLLSHGVKASTKIAAISKVSYKEEQMIAGDLSSFSDIAAQKPLPTPTVILIGQNVDSLMTELDEK
ncbi:uroporphyrinogen-III C-methyltransferase [Halosquirtibacter xylanolyticus]|uniref:uroporphyrinogen-III C-methyltransferase n=1 Tax=Halosquirtibacter xylanolyticus TaxID=3374599 RepID=UPI0037498BBF|nr:uroporphyrinogen-III C-methyltransferase [Prolixibacteraceae bacterium]